ncbi:MAG: hypothetical protein ACLQID_23770 [Streptosporangiaceae bacterium]
MAGRKLACGGHGLVRPRWLSQLGGDADGERVAADTGEVLAEQVGCSHGIAGGGSPEHFDVVAFPVHLPVTGISGRGSGDGFEIGEGEPEGRVGADGAPQCGHGLAQVHGSLCLPVTFGRPLVCRDHAAVVLNGRPGGRQVIAAARWLASGWLHDCQVDRVA